MADSVHKSIADAVNTAIGALGLTGIDAAHVFTTWGGDIAPYGLPAVFVCPIGTMAYLGGTNERDDIGYPITIFIIDRESLEDTGKIDQALLWREKIRKKFINQRLTAVGTVYTCRVQGSAVVDVGLSQGFQLLVEPLNLQFVSRETRG